MYGKSYNTGTTKSDLSLGEILDSVTTPLGVLKFRSLIVSYATSVIFGNIRVQYEPVVIYAELLAKSFTQSFFIQMKDS